MIRPFISEEQALNGLIDESHRTLVPLTARSCSYSPREDINVWIDTAYDGEVVMPMELINRLGLELCAAVQATLADGTNVILETFACEIEWFSQWKRIEVIANDGRFPLLGLELLKDRKLIADFRRRTLELE